MILDHSGFNVSDFAASKSFLVQSRPTGNRDCRRRPWLGHARQRRQGQLWFGALGAVPGPIHVAFVAENRAQVRKFHAAAMEIGAKDNGPPGLRTHYHANDYGAFVIGPDGHNFEAVCHAPET